MSEIFILEKDLSDEFKLRMDGYLNQITEAFRIPSVIINQREEEQESCGITVPINHQGELVIEFKHVKSELIIVDNSINEE